MALLGCEKMEQGAKECKPPDCSSHGTVECNLSWICGDMLDICCETCCEELHEHVVRTCMKTCVETYVKLA